MQACRKDTLEQGAKHLITKYADRLLTSTRAKVRELDMQCLLFIHHQCLGEHISVDKAEGLWKNIMVELEEQGMPTRGFDCHRWAAMRNLINDLGLLTWTDNSYMPSYVDRVTGEVVEGECCRYGLSNLGISLINNELTKFQSSTREREPAAGTRILETLTLSHPVVRPVLRMYRRESVLRWEQVEYMNQVIAA